MFALFAVLPVLISSLLILAIRKNRAAKYIALAGSIISLAFAVIVFLTPSAQYSVDWFSASNLVFHITIVTYALNKILLLLVAAITPLIFTYSIGFMDAQREQSRFYTEIGIFAAAMMLFAISGNLITMFIAWEVLGITSYLLIGFWYNKQKPPLAARKSITTIIIGDIFFLMAIVVILSAYGTTNIASLISTAQNSHIQLPLDASLIFILVAVFTKSAQFPFHEWLSDAMEGPTPVSAFLHSSTMVKAGVFLVMVLLPLYAMANLEWILLVIGIASATVAIMNALSEHHIKKILAYSTIEDLSLMLIALGLNNLLAALLLFIVQTFYKALLFMGAGYVMKANDGEEDIFKVYNIKKNKMLFATVVIGVLSLAGVAPFGGFFAKASLDSSATDIYVYAALLAFDLLSSMYIFRWLIVPSGKSDKNMQYKAPRSMAIPMAILAAFTAISGISFFALGMNSAQPLNILDMVIESGLVISGFIISYLFYAKGLLPNVSLYSLKYRIMHNSFFLNIFYYKIAGFFEELGEQFDLFDHSVNRLFNMCGGTLVRSGNFIRKVENGNVNVYAVIFVFGIVALLAVFEIVAVL